MTHAAVFEVPGSNATEAVVLTLTANEVYNLEHTLTAVPTDAAFNLCETVK